MYCPKCKSEYREGFTICSDCKETLVEGNPNIDNSNNTDTDENTPVKLKTVSSEVEAGLIMNLLENNNIPSYKKSIGAGGYLNVIMGYSIYGEEIYVAMKDFATANAILNELSETEGFIDFDKSDMVSINNEASKSQSAENSLSDYSPEDNISTVNELRKDTGNEKEMKNKTLFYKGPQLMARIILIMYVLYMIGALVMDKISK